MLQIEYGEGGSVILVGRFDASQAAKAEAFLDGTSGSVVLDCRRLQYISSLGLGVLIKTYKRLRAGGGELRLVNLSPHLRDVLTFAGFDRIFDLGAAPPE